MRRVVSVCLAFAIGVAVVGLAIPASGAAPDCPCTLWPPSAIPATVSVNDPNAVELGVKFRADVDGQIVGVRFYKGVQNTGTHTGTLWSGAGQQLATATFTGETASGWQQVAFATPVDVSAGTTYVASYHTDVGFYAASNGYFAQSGVDSGPLHAPDSGAAGGNGVYRYGAGGFPNRTHQSTNYWVDIVFATSAVPAPSPPTPPPSAQPPSTQPRLLDSYTIANPQPDYAIVRYRPRQFVAGVDVDPFTGGALVNSPGSYAGWDVLNTPNQQINRAMNNPNWLTLQLNRPATLAIVWRAGNPLPNWLGGWTRSGMVVVGGTSWPTYTRSFGAGTVALGSVWDTAGLGPYGRDTYLVLFAEADGHPTPPPGTPGGRVAPVPNQPCPGWVHDQHVATGPDGKVYPTWHPQIDPVYWCYFGHEHGSNPAYFDADYKPLYGYTASTMGMEETHPGFKSYVFEDDGYLVLVTQHFGTGALKRACTRFHTIDFVFKENASGRIVADLHLMGDYGPAVVNNGDAPLTPPDCPNQAAQAAGSNGIRKLPSADTGGIGYEPWRVAGANVLGLDTGAFLINTSDPIVICNSALCDQAVPTGGTGTLRFFQYGPRLGVRAGANTGVFYTDPHATGLMAPGQPGAVRQFVQPGISFGLGLPSADSECYDVEGWGRPYQCGPDPLRGGPTVREDSIRGPN